MSALARPHGRAYWRNPGTLTNGIIHTAPSPHSTLNRIMSLRSNSRLSLCHPGVLAYRPLAFFLLSVWLVWLPIRSAAQCLSVVPSNAATSPNARAPISSQRYQRAHYLVTANGMAAAGYVNGDVFAGIEWK